MRVRGNYEALFRDLQYSMKNTEYQSKSAEYKDRVAINKDFSDQEKYAPLLQTIDSKHRHVALSLNQRSVTLRKEQLTKELDLTTTSARYRKLYTQYKALEHKLNEEIV